MERGICEMTKKKIAIIGAGSIGTTIADEISNHLDEYYELVGIMKNSESRIKELEMTYKVPVVTECSKLLETKPDFIIEAAGVEVVKEYGETILKHGVHFIPLSVGGLADPDFYQTLGQTAKENSAVLYIPSGAIGGFDLMRKMTLVNPPEVEIHTSKAPSSLEGAPYLAGRELSETEKEVIFDDSATEAIKGFPQNINVAIATALATVGPDQTRTVIQSDPELEANVHEITVTNKEGTANIRFASKPSDNPRTSSITAWSVISLLKNIAEPVRFF